MALDKYNDDRLDDKFESVDRRLTDVEDKLKSMNGMPATMATLAASIGALASRMDRFREDTRDDFKAVHNDIKTVSHTQVALLTALLAAMIGAIIVLLVAL